MRGDETLTTMNRHELKDIVARRIVDEHRKHGKSLADGNEWAAIAAAKIIGTLNDIGALAAAKEEHGKHEICPPHVIYEAVGGGMICSGCEQRFAPAKGLDVDGVMKIVEREVLTHQRISETLRGIRKALEAHAEKGGDNLRKG